MTPGNPSKGFAQSHASAANRVYVGGMKMNKHFFASLVAALFLSWGQGAFAEQIVNPTAVFSGLDKITGRIVQFDVAIDETVQFGALQVTPRACYSRPPTETPKTTGFIEVDEIRLDRSVERIFSGWMFADSPGLNAVEHPVYDVWLINCKATAPEIPGSN